MVLLRVPGSLRYRNMTLRVVAAACALPLEGAGGIGAEWSLSDEPPEANSFEAETVTAVGEAFNNVAIHAYRDVPGDVELTIDSDATGVEIRMTDWGRSFDPSLVPSPDLDELPENGMGLFIMRSFMDEVDYLPGAPNVLRMVKRRVGASGQAVGSGGSSAPFPPSGATSGGTRSGAARARAAERGLEP